jgi:modulator of FtsH protease
MWTNFFVAGAGAAAALAGLAIVAISANLARILEFPHLPARAAATIARLILILVSSMAALIPQPVPVLGVEIVLFTLAAWSLEIRSNRRALRAHTELGRPRFESLLESIVGEVQMLPFLVGGILLSTGRASGYFGVAAGVIAIFIFSTLNVWVLLVEILR